MKRFRFKLETILALRKRREEEVKLLLGKKNREIITARKELTEVSEALKNLQADEKRKRSDVKSALELRYSVAYRYKLRQDILKKACQIDDFLAQAVDIRKKLVKAKQERSAIEIVREKQYEAWHEEMKSAEQKFIDDVSQQGFIRKMREKEKEMVEER
jgi:flagellar protein FliJ